MYNIFVDKIKVYSWKLFNSAKDGKEVKMQITDIKVRKLFDEGPMKAVISVTFDGQLAVHDIKVINARDRLFIVMPSRKSPDDTYRDIVHPITADFRRALEEQIIEKYEEAIRLSETADEADAAEITG